MFPTFTGNSRRPRNVNLSGQRNINPWATPTWSASGSGASKTVAQAQAEREKRQKERDELNASKRLQRVWRGYQERRNFKQTCRQEYDALYSQPKRYDLSRRLNSALPLLLKLFDPKQPADQQRLDLFIKDLASLGSAPSNFEVFSPNSWDRLAGLIVGALDKRPASSSLDLLRILIDIVKRRPLSIAHILSQYYILLSKYFEQSNHKGVQTEDYGILMEAATAPLISSSEEALPVLQAYEAFAFSFLTSSSLLFLRQSPGRIAGVVDIKTLSLTVIDAYKRRDHVSALSKSDSLWLLAHFIALNRAVPTSQGTKYLEALYIQLSLLVDDIRIRYSRHNALDEAHDDDDDTSEHSGGVIEDSVHFSTWVLSQLDSLVDEDGISELLRRFTSTSLSPDRLSEDASLLAGYTLVLLRCFPSHNDDIKMRLFQGDISMDSPAGSTSTPSVKYFWTAASNTSIFKSIMQPRATQQVSSIVILLQPDPTRDREWRTLLLFLELYNFLLRVTDDEDFLPSESQIISQQSAATSRIRSSGLTLSELKQLINFLKSLSFPLYYHLSEIMPSTSRPTRLNSLIGVSSGRLSTQDEEVKAAQSSFAGIIGMDVLGLRSASTATMRSLYERDSRRRFLPADFWLMTSKFDMDGFISAVVLEEQQKDQMEEDEDDSSDSDTPDTFLTSTGQRLSRAAQIEKLRRLRRVQREQLLAQVGPKLEVLRNMPFVIPFEVRVQIFRQFVYLDKQKRRGGHVDPDRWRLSVISGEGGFNGPTARGRDILSHHSARVKRGQVFDDGYEQFYPLGEGLKEPIQITFVDQFDQPEAGIDGGGVTKEFLTSITDEALTPGSGGHNLFVTNSQNLLYPDPTAFDNLAESLRYRGFRENDARWKEEMIERTKRYEFLGRVLGKCMYEGILIDKAFAGFFLLKWSASGQGSLNDYRANLNDLRDLDPELYQGLISLKNYPGKVLDLSLDFTITDQVTKFNGEVSTITRPLCKNGEDIPVTNINRPLYISYVTNHRLVAQPYRQTRAFLKGLGSIINPAWLSMFNQSELQRLVGGDSSEIDVEDLRRHTQYSGLYSIGDDGMEHATIQMFWQVMREFQDSERREVLKYVTSTPRAPLLGFSQLSPPFSIRDGGVDEERLPSTSTCVNLLKLPRYNSKETLKSKLLYAIQSGAGFDLS